MVGFKQFWRDPKETLNLLFTELNNNKVLTTFTEKIYDIFTGVCMDTFLVSII